MCHGLQVGTTRTSDARKADSMCEAIGIDVYNSPCVLIANSSGGGIATTLDASYYKGQGVRQGIEREYIVVSNGDTLSDKR